MTVFGCVSFEAMDASRKKRVELGIVVAGVVRVQHLERDQATERLLLGAVDLAHAAARDDADDSIAVIDDAADQRIGALVADARNRERRIARVIHGKPLAWRARLPASNALRGWRLHGPPSQLRAS